MLSKDTSYACICGFRNIAYVSAILCVALTILTAFLGSSFYFTSKDLDNTNSKYEQCLITSGFPRPVYTMKTPDSWLNEEPHQDFSQDLPSTPDTETQCLPRE